MAEAPVLALLDELEAGPLVEAPGVDEDVVRPQHDRAVAGVACVRDTRFDEASSDTEPAGPRLDEKQAQGICGTLKTRKTDCVAVPPAKQ